MKEAPEPRLQKDLFQQCLALPPAQRAAFLATLPADVASEVAALVAAVVPDSEFLGGLRDPGAATNEPLPAAIGPYRVLCVLGQGGMGTVYLAEQHEPIHRRVAVKQIRDGLGSRDFVARFQRERQVLASLQHPGIASVLDCGADAGAPWFAMEYIDGVPLLRFCDEARLAIEPRLHLFLDLCAAIDHAHQRQVIHRDLKPSNVLVTGGAGQPQVKVIDFGLAGLLAAGDSGERLTRPEHVLGTPEYMAPEQRSGGVVDVRADVFALGVILYELLCGFLPHDHQHGTTTAQLVSDVRRPSERMTARDPTIDEVAAARSARPSQLRVRLRHDLDWIVLKAIEAQPDRRYATVAALAEDLRRSLDHRPIAAGPPSLGTRLRKLMRRRRVALLSATTVVLAVTALLFGSQWFRAQDSQAAMVTLRTAELAERDGQLAARDGDWPTAQAKFTAALAASPIDPLAIEIPLHDVLAALGKNAAAAQLLARIIPVAPETAHAATVAMLHGADLVCTDQPEGSERLREALKLDGTGRSRLAPADREFAEAMLATGLDEINNRLRAALGHDNKHLRSMHMLGPILLLRGQPEAALQLAHDFERSFQHATEPLLLRSFALAAAGRNDEAKAACGALDSSPLAALRPTMEAVITLLHAIDQIADGVARHEVFSGLYNGLRGEDQSVVPLPPLRLATDLQKRLELAPIELQLLKAVRTLEKATAQPAAIDTALRWHPWIRANYSLTRLAVTAEAISTRQLPADRDTILPEAILAALYRSQDIRAPAPAWAGWTAALPAVRRLHIWLDVGTAIMAGASGSWRLAAPHDQAFSTAVDAARQANLSDLEYVGLAFLTTNMKVPGGTDLADRVMVSWEMLHGRSARWLLFKAELNLAGGARGPAREKLDEAAAQDQERPWQQSLAERLR